MRTRTRDNITIATPNTVCTLIATNHSASVWYPVLQPDPNYPSLGPVGPGATVVLWTSDTFITRTGTSSVMTDTTGPNLTYRDCIHDKIDWSQSTHIPVDETRRAMLPDKFGPEKDITLHLQGLVSADFWLNQMATSSGSLFSTTNSMMEAIARGQINWSAIAPHIDLPRSIAELKDFNHIFKSVRRSLTEVARIFTQAQNAGVSGRILLQNLQFHIKRKGNKIAARLPKGPGEFVDAGISADLSYKFLIKPFLSDMEKVMELSAKAEQLIKILSEPQRIPVRGKAVTSSALDYNRVSPDGNHSVLERGSGTHTCVAWCMLELSPMNVSEIQALREVASLRLNLRTAWELVPLSFIFEWFVKVGNILSYLDRGRQLQRPFHIVSSGYSHKMEYAGVCLLSMLPKAAHPFGASWIATPVAVGKVTKTSYVRQAVKIWPNEVTLPPPIEFSLPNLGQAITLTELIYSFLRSLRAKKVTNNTHHK